MLTRINRYTIKHILILVTLFAVSIPFLLTKLLWEYVEVFSTSPPDEDHFYIVAGLFWGNLFAYCGALVALRWFRKTQLEKQSQGNQPLFDA